LPDTKENSAHTSYKVEWKHTASKRTFRRWARWRVTESGLSVCVTGRRSVVPPATRTDGGVTIYRTGPVPWPEMTDYFTSTTN